MTSETIDSAASPAFAHPAPEGFDRAQAKLRALEENIRQVMVGKDEAIRMALVPLICRGHLLIEDVPGIGKTTLAKSIAKSLSAEFRRVQFTPDLLPLDITGSAIFNQKTGEFDFKQGPVFTNVLLADEINRATPRTQSALLECMEEFHVTVDGCTRRLPEVFFVVATLNPLEQSGTFPLPETQLDRFLLRLRLGYPSEAEEVQVFDRQAAGHPIETLRPALAASDVVEVAAVARSVFVHPSLKEYAAKLTRATRSHPDVVLGASPRGTLGLIRSSQVLALENRRPYVTPDDFKRLAPLVLGHRVVLKPQSQMRGVTDEAVIRDVLAAVEVPIAADEMA
jgi:MoxR-like ATPase